MRHWAPCLPFSWIKSHQWIKKKNATSAPEFLYRHIDSSFYPSLLCYLSRNNFLSFLFSLLYFLTQINSNHSCCFKEKVQVGNKITLSKQPQTSRLLCVDFITSISSNLCSLFSTLPCSIRNPRSRQTLSKSI